MTTCDIIPLAPAKACSGKCRGDGCASSPTVWVLAACEGKAALFSKQVDGRLILVLEQGSPVSSFEGGLREQLIKASDHADFAQLVLVGSANDIAWTQASLPDAVSKRVVAEVEYPLISAWFGSTSQMSKLTQALTHVLEA